MYRDRISLYSELETIRASKVLIYITGDRPSLETQMHPEVYDFFVNHLDQIGAVPKISLYLILIYSRWRDPGCMGFCQSH